MDTVAVTITVPVFDHDALLAELSDGPIQGALQEDDRLIAYVPADAWTDARHHALAQWLVAHGYTAGDLDVRIEHEQNWNAAWEATITPVRAGSFLLRPTWADVPPEHADATVLTVDPKMSFGTGHHATTRLVLRLLPNAVQAGDRVLDAGTGTGVLAIAACMCGADAVLAVDVRDAAIENARENCARNEVADRVTLRTASVDAVEATGFDVICANITRDIILEMLPTWVQQLALGGRLVVSGLLHRDRARVVEAAETHGFALQEDATDDGWWAGHFQRPA